MYGIFVWIRKFSRKHLDRYVLEFACQHSVFKLDILDQMHSIVSDIEAKRLKYKERVEFRSDTYYSKMIKA